MSAIIERKFGPGIVVCPCNQYSVLSTVRHEVVSPGPGRPT